MRLCRAATLSARAPKSQAIRTKVDKRSMVGARAERPQSVKGELQRRISHDNGSIQGTPYRVGGKAVAIVGIDPGTIAWHRFECRRKALSNPQRQRVAAIVLIRLPRGPVRNQQALLRQGVHALRLSGKEIELIGIERLAGIDGYEDRRSRKQTKQSISDGRKRRPEPFVNGIASLDLEHDQGRMAGEELPAARDDALFFAFSVDLDEIGRRPSAGRVLRIQAGDCDLLPRPALAERIQLARSTEQGCPSRSPSDSAAASISRLPTALSSRLRASKERGSLAGS